MEELASTIARELPWIFAFAKGYLIVMASIAIIGFVGVAIFFTRTWLSIKKDRRGSKRITF